jgi:hypothetical protein
MRNRLKYMKDNHGKVKSENDDDWPRVIVQFTTNERVIYTADGRSLVLQQRHRTLRDDKWSKWRFVLWTKSHEEMRKLLEKFYPFAPDSGKLDAICLKTDDGDYVELSR